MLKVLHLDKEQEFLYFDAVDILSSEFPESRTMQELYLNPGSYIEKMMVVIKKGRAIAALKRGFNPDRVATTIDFLAVIPEFQGQGIGTRLAAELEDYAREKQTPRVGLFTRRTTNVHKFYKKLGYSFARDYEPSWMEKIL